MSRKLPVDLTTDSGVVLSRTGHVVESGAFRRPQKRWVKSMHDSWQINLDEGLTAYRNGDFAAALAKYEQCCHDCKENPQQLALSLLKCAEIEVEMGQFTKARECFEQSLSIAKKENLSEKIQWEIYLSYGRLERILARIEHAVELLDKAVQMCPKDEPHSLALAHSERAYCYYNADRIDDGRADVDAAVAAWIGPFETDESVQICCNLSHCYISQKNFPKALEVANRALEISGAQFGEEHPSAIPALINKAVASVNFMDVATVEQAANQCLKIAREKLGESHYQYGYAFAALASVTLLRGDFEKTEKLLNDSYEITIRTFGTKHPSSCEIMQLKAFLLGRQQKMDECIQIFKDILPVLQSIYGDGHSKVSECANALSLHLQMAGKWSEAESFAQQHKDKTEQIYGKNHPATIGANANICLLQLKQNKRKEAEQHLDECLAARSQLMCEDNLETANLSSLLGTVCISVGRLDEAKELILDAKDIAERLLGADNVRAKAHAASLKIIEMKIQARDASAQAEGKSAGETERAINQEVSSSIKQMFESHMSQGLKATAIMPLQAAVTLSISSQNWAEAEAQCRQLLTLLREQTGDEHNAVGTANHLLGVALFMQNKLGATDALKNAIDIFEKNDAKQNLAGSLGFLVLANGKDGKMDDAQTCFDKMHAIHTEAGTLSQPGFLNIAKAHATFLRRANKEEMARNIEAIISVSNTTKQDGP